MTASENGGEGSGVKILKNELLLKCQWPLRYLFICPHRKETLFVCQPAKIRNQIKTNKRDFSFHGHKDGSE